MITVKLQECISQRTIDGQVKRMYEGKIRINGVDHMSTNSVHGAIIVDKIGNGWQTGIKQAEQKAAAELLAGVYSPALYNDSLWSYLSTYWLQNSPNIYLDQLSRLRDYYVANLTHLYNKLQRINDDQRGALLKHSVASTKMSINQVNATIDSIDNKMSEVAHLIEGQY